LFLALWIWKKIGIVVICYITVRVKAKADPKLLGKSAVETYLHECNQWKGDPDPQGSVSLADLHQSQMLDPVPHHNQNSGAVDAHNRALKGQGSE
jgi:hypothetical protein